MEGRKTAHGKILKKWEKARQEHDDEDSGGRNFISTPNMARHKKGAWRLSRQQQQRVVRSRSVVNDIFKHVGFDDENLHEF